MVDVDIKTVVQNFEKKVTELKKETDNLEKKKTNLESDVEDLIRQQRELKDKVDNRSATLEKEVSKATQSALDRLNEAEVEVKVEKGKVAQNNNILTSKIADYDSKVKETERLKVNLQASIKEYESKVKDVVALKAKLNGIVNSIVEVLK